VPYSLAKYLRLAIKGNPTVMLPLFAPPESLIVVTPLGEELRAMRKLFMSQQAVERFLGYVHSQHGQSHLPLPIPERARVLALKRDEVPREDVSAEIGRIEADVRALLDEGRTPLPPTADHEAVTRWAVSAHRRQWRW